MLNAVVTIRIIFGTCLFPIVTLWQRHSISIYVESRKAQVTTREHVNTYDGTQDNGSLQGQNIVTNRSSSSPTISDFKCYLKSKTESIMQIYFKGSVLLVCLQCMYGPAHTQRRGKKKKVILLKVHPLIPMMPARTGT